MAEIFNYDNKFSQGLSKVFDILYVSVLWVLACIPIVTIGAATTALYYTVNKVVRHGRGYIWKDFWGAFRSNFKQSTIVWLVVMAASALLIFDTYVMWHVAAAGQSIGKIYLFFTIVEIFVVMWAIYLFSYIARFENTTKATMKNAFIITFANLPRTLLMLAVLLLGVFLVYLFTYSIVLVPGLCALLISYPMETIFRKYMSEEERAAEDERNGIYVSDQK